MPLNPGGMKCEINWKVGRIKIDAYLGESKLREIGSEELAERIWAFLDSISVGDAPTAPEPEGEGAEYAGS